MKKSYNPVITIIFGWFGLHRYMAGQIGTGILYTCTLGLFGIGWISDIKKSFSRNQTSSVSNAPLQGFQFIASVRHLNKASLYALQLLLFPNTKRGDFSTDQILRACDSTLSQSLRIISDCKDLIYKTDNPKVFYERYDLLLEKYKDISTFEPYVVIYGYQPLESIDYYRDSKPRYERKMIDRCYNKALIKADSLKTEKGKTNQFYKAYNELKSHHAIMFPENITYMDNKFRKR